MSIQKGSRAPDFDLPRLAPGGESGSDARGRLRDFLLQGPVLLIFVKETCPTCEYALPLVDRLYRNYPGSAVSILTIAQEKSVAASRMVRNWGVRMPVYLDLSPHPVSEDYRLSFVPTFCYIGPDGLIERIVESFAREELQEINAKLAVATGVVPFPLFAPEEGIPAFRPG